MFEWCNNYDVISCIKYSSRSQSFHENAYLNLEQNISLGKLQKRCANECLSGEKTPNYERRTPRQPVNGNTEKMGENKTRVSLVKHIRACPQAKCAKHVSPT